jgi:hypothetical protein
VRSFVNVFVQVVDVELKVCVYREELAETGDDTAFFRHSGLLLPISEIHGAPSKLEDAGLAGVVPDRERTRVV